MSSYAHFLPFLSLFFFNDTPPTEIYTLSLHDALPISRRRKHRRPEARRVHTAYGAVPRGDRGRGGASDGGAQRRDGRRDRKSTRLNSSHTVISYAVFCLKKKKKEFSATDRLFNRVTFS